jgi:pilus assembly protein CpaB
MRISKLKSFKPNKTWVVLGVAVFIGLLAALAASSYLSGRIADLEGSARGNKKPVVVAKVEISKGTKLSNANLAVRSIPVEFAHSTSIAPEQFDRIDGQSLAYNVKAGEMIFWGLLESKKAPTFSARIEMGRRAITVPVDEISSISGMLEPGDLIDLMVSVERKGKKITLPLMQRVPIMATGQRAVDDPKSGERRLFSTVTLDADLSQAKNLIVAREVGHITALLRNPGDRTLIPDGQVDLAALLGAGQGGPAVSDSGEVPVLYGGKTGKMSPESLRLGQYQAQAPTAAPTPTDVTPAVVPTAPR